MPTIKQKRAAKKTLENLGSTNPKTQGEILLESGYKPTVADTPTIVTESKGFQEACDELGLTDNLLITSLVEDIKTKKGNRKPELELGFKVKQHLKEKGLLEGLSGSGKLVVAWQTKP